MKVAFLSFDFGEYSVRLANALAEHASILLLLPEGLADPFLGELDPKVDFRPFPRARLRQALRQLSRYRWIMKQVRGFGADILHMQHGSMWFNVGLSLNRRLRVVVTVHDAEPHPGDKESQRTPYFFWKLGFRRADKIIAHNRHIQHLLETKLGFAADSIQVIPHVQIGHLSEGSERQCKDKPDILFFGRIWPYKGLEYLIRAEPLITASIPSARIIIAGVGENLVRYQAEMRHPERFLILNRYIRDDETVQLFQSASVVVLPYIESSQSGVIPLAYTYGKPVVATAVGGLPEMVVHGVTGLLVPPRDERQLADAIVMLLGNDALRKKMGDAAKRFIQRNCSPSLVAQETMGVYRGVAVGLPEKERYDQRVAKRQQG